VTNDQSELAALQEENAALRAQTAELRGAAQLLAALATVSSDFIAVVDREGTYRQVLPTRIVDEQLRQGVGSRMHQFMPAAQADQFVAAIRTALDGGKASTIDYNFAAGDRQLWFTATVSPLDGELALWVARNVTEQHELARAEEERVALREQMLEAQRATLRELSTPLIPLADNVVVMPIVGTIDSTRAQQIMEVLLEGIAQYQCDAVLLDISGVRVVDTQVADALLRTAKAVKLLGAQVILTGISAEVAQTIVHLGADMSTIITQSNLQSGLRYALERYAADWDGQLIK